MRNRFVLVVCIVALTLSACSIQSQNTSSGIDVRVLNGAALSEIYVPFNFRGGEQVIRSAQDSIRGPAGGTYRKISQIDLQLLNRGYADSVAALYVSGYDPNLFYVEPQPPFARQSGNNFCYKDIYIQDQGSYAINAVCAINQNVILGGGLDRSDGNLDVNVNAFLRSVTDRLQNSDSVFLQSVGTVFDDAVIDCTFRDVEDGVGDVACSLSSSFIDFLNRRSSRGLLALALYGDQIRDCSNNCIVVPSPIMPRKFIAGNTPDSPGGDIYNVPLDVYMNDDRWPSGLYERQQAFQITACYLYTTYATPIVCVDPTPAQSDGDVCRPGVQEMNTGQPAPLAITSIEQINQGSRIMFKINVRNARQGTPFNPGAIDFCAPGAPETYSREVRNTAKVIDARILGELTSLDCRDGTIRLDDNGRGSINCFYDIPARAYQTGAYQTSLNIEIGYLYRDIQTITSNIIRN